jgi:hypothetical protein
MDEIRIYNYARTQEQIISDMNAGHPAPGSPVGSALHHFKFDEGYGDTAYDTGTGGTDGDLGAGTTCPQAGDSTCPIWTNDGKIGKAIDFERNATTPDYIDLGAGTDGGPMDLDDGDFTLSAWVNLESIGEDRCIICQGDAAQSRAIELKYDHGETRFEFDTNDGGWKYAKYDLLVPPSLSTWYHVVGVRDGSTIKIYVNGLQGGTTATIGTITNMDADSWSIGRLGDAAARYWDGQIDEVKAYNFALTDTQILAEYNQGKAAVFGATSTDSSGDATWSAVNEYCPPGQGSTCIAPDGEWKFDDNVGTGSDAVKDTSGNGYHLNMESSMTESDWVEGIEGSALNFDGSDDSATVGGDNAFEGDNVGSVSMWLKSASPSTLDGFFSTEDGGRDKVGYIESGTYKMAVWDGAASRAVSGGVVDTDWHFIYFTWDGSAGYVYLYVDGVLVDSDDGVAWTGGTGTATYFG